MVRKEIRSKLFINNLQVENSLLSLQECRLDKDLVNIKYASLENYQNYKITTGFGKYGAEILKPVFVTEFDRSEYEGVESKTKVEILNKIVKIIDEILDKDITSA